MSLLLWVPHFYSSLVRGLPMVLVILLSTPFAFSDSPAQAVAGLRPSFSLSQNLVNWSLDLCHESRSAKTDQSPYWSLQKTECAWLEDVPNTLLCTGSRRNIIPPFARASMFAEGNFSFPEGDVVSHKDPLFRGFAFNSPDFNLRGQDLIRFVKAVEKKCFFLQKAKGHDDPADYCFSQSERDILLDFLIPLAEKNPKMLVITSTFNPSSFDWSGTLAHEFYHAQFAANPAYQQAVRKFFYSKVSKQDQALIRQEFRFLYNPKNERILIDEFQAYLLGGGRLHDFSERYRDQLLKYLRHQGIEIKNPQTSSDYPWGKTQNCGE